MGPLENGDPERIGRYRLIGRLGAGGMGLVYFGRSAGGRAVAVKRIHPHMAGDATFRQRFAREVNAARQVSGAFTAPVIDADTDADMPWLVTSYVSSLPLDEAVRDHGPLPEASLRTLAAGLAEALTEIHRCGLIHRDLKPGNVLLAEDGPRVIDFGIARATEGTAATQSVIGTPGFMSPEQVQGEAMTPRSDMFAFGAVLVHAACGTGPFGEGAMPTMVMRILQNEPDIAAVPPSLRGVVGACLAKDVRYRPEPGQVLDALGEAPTGASWLPPAFMNGIAEQVNRVNSAVSEQPSQAGAHSAGTSPGATAAFGAGGAAGAGAAAMPGDDAATRQFSGRHGDATRALTQEGQPGATSVMGAGQAGAAHSAGQAPPPYVPPAGGGTAQHPPPYTPATSAMPAERTSGADAYSDLYRSDEHGARRGRQEADQRQQEQREQQRQQEEMRRQQRRQAEEQAHQQRMRAEQDAARRAGHRSSKAEQPSLWSFVKILPLLVIPFIQIPLGWAASHAWAWFTTTDGYWGLPWTYEGFFSVDGFFHALGLGYFLLNNVVGLEYLVRSLRTGYVTGAMLGLFAVLGTDCILWYFGFFG